MLWNLFAEKLSSMQPGVISGLVIGGSERIVKKVRQEGNGFQDLIVALVLSESFD